MWRDAVQSLQGVQSLLVAGLRGGLPDVLLGARTGMGSGTGSQGVDRGIDRNARDTRDVHTQGSRHHWIVLKNGSERLSVRVEFNKREI